MTEAELRAYFARTAAKYLGITEGGTEHRALVELYNSHSPLARGYRLQYSDPWCAGFVSAVAIECGLTRIIPTEVGCGRMIALFQELGCWSDRGEAAELGDVVFYDWDGAGNADHVGIVETVQGDCATVIEGNYSNMVKRRTIRLDSGCILGLGKPDFAMLEVRDVRYETMEELPAYAAATIGKLVDDGSLLGKGDGRLDLSEDMVRILVILDRRGLLG